MADQPFITLDPGEGGFRCHFWGANGKLVWWTQTYDRKQSAEQAIQFLQHWTPRVVAYDRT